ncbi:MAG: hypothetical protein K5987_05355 [Lachnospiraceae bacterium]|nr:hypothetical protein [Lachnospiraceae bacterium]
MDKLQNPRFIFILTSVCALLGMAAFLFFKWNADRTAVFDTSDAVFDEGFEGYFTVESISDENGLTVISGYDIAYGLPSAETPAVILLKDLSDGTFYRLPTQIKDRTDISSAIADGTDYSLCGFRSFTDKDLNDHDYEIYGCFFLPKSGERIIKKASDEIL